MPDVPILQDPPPLKAGRKPNREKDREAVQLRNAGLSLREIANRMGVKPPSVHRRLARIRHEQQQP